ncbi:ATP-binding protein [Cytophagaceae bacterium ABcell3]|nr:ATP-binding protein [Cytophagaceae bacterium ABcell3]
MKLLSRHKIVFTYGLSIVNLVVIVLFTLLLTNHKYNKLHNEENVFKLIHALENLELALTRSETDVKNYLLTSDKRYIEEYNGLKSELYDKIDSLNGLLVVDDKKHSSRFDDLNELIEARLFLLDYAIEIQDKGGVEDASWFLKTFNDKEYSEKISEIKSEIISMQKDMIRAEKAEKELNLQVREYIIVSASMASLFISIIAVGTIVRDLNHRIRNERKLMRLNKDKDRFFSIISHDLRGPAHNLIALCDIMQNDDLSDGERKHLVQMMQSSSRQNYNLLISLLDWAKMQLGDFKAKPVMADLHDIAAENLNIYAGNARQKGIKMLNKVPRGAMAFVDPDMMKTILRNTITNAIKYTNSRGEVSISAETTKDHVTLKVVDTGVGMDRKTMDKLFKLGYQRSKKGTAGEEGTGLGLLLCEEFVKKCGGKIMLDSQKGKGTTVSISLPLTEKVGSYKKGSRMWL